MTVQRIVRPEPERLEPARNFSSLLGEPAPDPAARELSVGYRVLEDYLRDGARAAREHELHDPAQAEPLIQRIARASSDFGAVWLELVRALLSSASGAPGPVGSDPGPFRMPDVPAPAAPDPAPAAPATTLSAESPRIRVHSLLPVELSFRWLQAAPMQEPLIVHELRGSDGAPAVSSVLAQYEGEALVLSIRIPDGQPPGCYSGLIVSSVSNLPQALLVVRVSSEP